MKNYNNDPRPMLSRFQSICSGCKKPILKNTEIVYFPATKTAKHKTCAEKDIKFFNESVFDEQVYNYQG